MGWRNHPSRRTPRSAVAVPGGSGHDHRSPFPDVEIPTTPLTAFVLRHASAVPDRPALVDGPSGHTITYGELADTVAWLAGGLAARGIGPGSVVGLMARTSPSTRWLSTRWPPWGPPSPPSTPPTRLTRCASSSSTPAPRTPRDHPRLRGHRHRGRRPARPSTRWWSSASTRAPRTWGPCSVTPSSRWRWRPPPPTWWRCPTRRAPPGSPRA